MADNNKKTRNPTSDLFRGLTRLFSGPIIKRRQQNYRRERRRSLKKYEFTSAAGKQFKKHSKDPFDSLASLDSTDLISFEVFIDKTFKDSSSCFDIQ